MIWHFFLQNKQRRWNASDYLFVLNSLLLAQTQVTVEMCGWAQTSPESTASNDLPATHLHLYLNVTLCDVTYGQVWWPILRICALHLTHPRCTHTAVNTHPHLRSITAPRPLSQCLCFFQPCCVPELMLISSVTSHFLSQQSLSVQSVT